MLNNRMLLDISAGRLLTCLHCWIQL